MVLTLILGIGLGSVGQTSTITDLENRVEELEDDVVLQISQKESVEEDLEATEDKLAAAKDELAPLKAKVARVEDQRTELQDRQAELASQAEDLDARESEISETERTLESSTIPDGTWQLGVDYEAGTYRAEGGGGCYWEKLNSPSGKFGDIIANGGFKPNESVVIDSPWFSTSDCGEWVKIG